MKKILSYLTKPIGQNIGMLLYFILLYGMVDTIGWIERAEVKYAVYTLLCILPIGYLSTLLYVVLPKCLRTVYLVIVSVYGIGWMMIDTVCNRIYQKPFNYDFAALIKYSDPAEGSDFISTYLTSGILIWFLVYVTIVMLVLWHAGIKRYKPRKAVEATCSVMIVLSTAVLFYATETGLSRSPYGKAYLFKYIKDVPDLHDYLTDPEIRVDTARQPKNIVIILGESHSRSHNWLNGYTKETNPETKLLIDKGLYVYSGAEAPGTSTLITISQYMSTYRPDKGGEWYEAITLPEVLKKGGYHTSWISNQGKRGLYDNAVTRYAELCDTAIFTSTYSTSVNTALYDETLLPHIGELSKSERNFTVIHMLGSHLRYHNRYPKAWERFTAADYAERPENQRQVLADYDNSIAYSDHVVSEIIRRYQDQEAMVVYFSDHGQDIFDTDPEYFGHARENDESTRHGVQIPLYVYLSDKYRARFPDMAEKIAQEKDSVINGNTFFYKIINWAGIELSDE